MNIMCVSLNTKSGGTSKTQ